MKKVIISSILALSLKAVALPAVLGQPAFGGNGCRPGSFIYEVSSDASAANIEFDELLAVTNVQTSRIQRASCNLAIPVKVSPGYSVALLPVLTGNVYTSGSGQSTLSLETFLAGSSSAPQKVTFQAADQAVRFPSNIKPKLQWTGCGQSTTLRLNFSMTNMGNDTATQIDTLKYQIVSRRCK